MYRAFDKIGETFCSSTTEESHEHRRAYRAGRVTMEEYFDARMQIVLSKLPAVLDREELTYIRESWKVFVCRELIPSGTFAMIRAGLLDGDDLGHEQKRGSAVSQQGNTAKESTNEGSEDLAQFKRGELTSEEYLERRLELQIAKLPVMKLLSPSEIEKLRDIMREQFLDDPVMRHYAELAAGRKSPADE